MAEYLITYAELQSIANAIREAAGADPLTNTGGDYIVDEDDLINLANAIRTAAGIETDLEWPTDFITQIESLSGMTIPAGTTTLAFPQDYIDIIETATTEEPEEEEESRNITIHTVYIPSPKTCERLVQEELITQATASMCIEFHNGMSPNPTDSAPALQEYFEGFSQSVGDDASNVLFEFNDSSNSLAFGELLMDSITDIVQQVISTLPSVVLQNIGSIDNVVFLNIDSDSYAEIDSGVTIQYLNTPVKYLLNVQNNLNAEDISINDVEADQTIIALLIEYRQIAEYGLQ